jgi:hypothetical protein
MAGSGFEENTVVRMLTENAIRRCMPHSPPLIEAPEEAQPDEKGLEG